MAIPSPSDRATISLDRRFRIPIRSCHTPAMDDERGERAIPGARLVHAMLRVADMDRALGFYCGVLGADIAFERPIGRDGRNVFLSLGDQAGAAQIELTSDAGLDHRHGDGCGHLGVAVADCAAACAIAAARGVPILRPPRRMASGAVIAFVADPDGHAIELIQPAPAR